jgi:hypothetical protein
MHITQCSMLLARRLATLDRIADLGCEPNHPVRQEEVKLIAAALKVAPAEERQFVLDHYKELTKEFMHDLECSPLLDDRLPVCAHR